MNTDYQGQELDTEGSGERVCKDVGVRSLDPFLN